MYFCSLQSYIDDLSKLAGFTLLKWLVYKMDHHQQKVVGVLPSTTLECVICDANSESADGCGKIEFYMRYVLQFLHIPSGAKLQTSTFIENLK